MTEETQQIKTFKGKYTTAVGRRKNAVAQVRIYKQGNGMIMVNDEPLEKYFSTPELRQTIKKPLVLAGLDGQVDISIIVKGGGKVGQSGAVSHGIARAILSNDKDVKPVLKAEKLLTRDSRRKERKKPGLKKARRAPQWSKR